MNITWQKVQQDPTLFIGYFNDEKNKKEYDNIIKGLKEIGADAPKKSYDDNDRSFTWRLFIYGYLNKLGKITKKQAEDIRFKITGKKSDYQALRHERNQHGLNIFSEKEGEYELKSIDSLFLGYSCDRRNKDYSNKDFESKKQYYNYKCANCGADEGKPHRYYEGKVILEQGHKDPRKPMNMENIIPQCQYCNQTYGDRFIHNDYGQIVKQIKFD